MDTEITVTEKHDRLDSFLATQLDKLSRSRIQSLIRDEHILLNQKKAKPRESIHPGDHISVVIPEAVPAEAVPQDIPINILYEDEDLLVLDKEHGMVVHPAPGNHDATLVNALLYHCKGKLSGIGGVERPGIVHRLDKDTSGCLVIAKSDVAHRDLVEQFANREGMTKKYLAVTQTAPKKANDTIFTHIGRHPVNRQKMAVVTPPSGKTAITDYQILNTNMDGTCLVRCDLHTGRTHQIRVHMHHIGTPILCDPIYNKKNSKLADRLMLHAWKLGFTHPITQKKVSFTANPPPVFAPWIDNLENT